MRITADQKIAGYPAVQIRQLMRETVGCSITPRYVREILQCSDSVALQMVNHLQTEGFVDSVNGHLEPSLKGSALAMATAAPPLRRDTAARLVTELVERARAINKDDRWAYRVGRLVVFGSYVRGAERPNDVDVGCEALVRWSGERQQEPSNSDGKSETEFPEPERVGQLAEIGGDSVSKVARDFNSRSR